MRFHVIDDEDQIAKTIVSMLRLLGHDAEAFTSPKKYLQYMKKGEYESPSAIMTDIEMPEMNGFEMIDTILMENPQQKYVFITGSQDLDHPLIDTSTMFLCKPISIKMLEMAAHAVQEV